MSTSVGETYRKASLVISAESPLPDGLPVSLGSIPGVLDSYAMYEEGYTADAGSGPFPARLVSQAPEALDSTVLLSGSWAGPGGVVVDETTATTQHLAVGHSVTFSALSLNGAQGAPTNPVTATVEGISRAPYDPVDAGFPEFTATVGLLQKLQGTSSLQSMMVLLAASPEISLETLRTHVEATLTAHGVSNAVIRTAPEQTIADVKALSGGYDLMTSVLLGFVGVALLVAALVVTNTFSVLIAQRTRELALLRCLGAGRSQVRNAVVGEAIVLGLGASLLGAGVAIVSSAGLIAILRAQPQYAFATLEISWIAVAVSVFAGTAFTAVAALAPARAATKVSPIVALRTQELTEATSPGKARIVSGFVILVVGVPCLLLGSFGSNGTAGLGIAMFGGLLCFTTVLMLGTWFFPPMTAVCARLALRAGIPGRLAGLNAMRNPGRTSATAVALLIGVTLVSLMMTGAETARVALEKGLSTKFPVDLTIHSQAGHPFGAAELAVAQSTDAVQAAALVPAVGEAMIAGTPATIFAVSPANAALIIKDANLAVRDGTILLPRGVPVEPVTLTGPAGSITLQAQIARSGYFEPLVSAGDAERIGLLETNGTVMTVTGAKTAEPASTLWLTLHPGLGGEDLQKLRATLAKQLNVPQINIDGAAFERQGYDQVISTMLVLVIGLLSVAILIAVIGVSNTLSLSILERTRENSLMRALGLTRQQLRATLAWEAALIAAVASIAGIAVGSLFGWLGAQAVLHLIDRISYVPPQLPWIQILGVLALAIAAGLFASIVPARRAAKLSPVEGLAI